MKLVMIFMICIIVSFIAGGVFIADIFGRKAVYYKQLAEKHLEIMKVFRQWLILYQNGGSVEKYFVIHGYKKIAIYGMGFLGERLLNELKNTEIKVEYLIDQNASYVYGEVPVYTLYDFLPFVDAIVVTPIYYFYTIKKQLKEKTDSKIISIENIFRN